MSTAATIAPHEEQQGAEATISLPADPPPASASLVFTEHPEAQQIVGTYRVHVAAEVIPSLQGEAFEDLVREIAEHGQRDAVIIHGDVLIEGIDTARAVGVLKERGVDIELQTVPWQPRPGQTVPEYLAYKLLQGPRFTDAQRAQIAAELLPLIEQERATAQQSARIKQGEVRNPLGINKRTTKGIDGCETHPPADAKARNKAKRERSTFGQIARLANVTEYAAKQAIKIKRLASQEDVSAVKAGIKKPKVVLAEMLPPEGLGKPHAKPPQPIDHPFTPKTPLQHDLLPGWIRLRDSKAAINERQQARDDMRAFFEAEEEAEKAAQCSSKGGGK